MSADYWIELYAQAELDADDEDGTAAPEQASELGRYYYYLEEEVDE